MSSVRLTRWGVGADRPLRGLASVRPGAGRCRDWLARAAGLALVLLAVLSAALPAQAQQPVPVPALTARVTDLTGTLAPDQRQRLEAELAAFEQRKGAQIAILLVATTQPETIEAYSMRVAEAWRLGRGRERAQRDTGDRTARAIDDGVLIVVARDDRKVRIEVGYGLEGVIPDAIAKRIIVESISPRFRAGDFAGGLQAAVADLTRRIEGEALPAPWQPAHDGEAVQGELLPLVLLAFLVGMFVSRIAGRFIGAVVGGGGAGLGASAALASGGLGAAVGVGVGLLVLVMGGRQGGGGPGGSLRRMGRRTIGHGPVIVPGPGWGGGGGGGWGGGGGGGGFGGGGGGFGGGGASGDW